MQAVKKTDKYIIYKKESGRYAIRNRKTGFINGQDKVNILVSEGLIKLPKPKAKTEEAATEEAPKSE